jgi:hypothetical protein
MKNDFHVYSPRMVPTHPSGSWTSSDRPLSLAYCGYISQSIQYARACFAYEDFSKRGKPLTKRLMLQGYNESRLK